MTFLPHPLQSAALARPDAPVFECAGDVLSAANACERVRRVAAALLEQGVVPGDRIYISGMASTAGWIALHAIGWVGAVVCAREKSADTLELMHAIDERPLRLYEATHVAPERWWPFHETRLEVLTSGSAGEPQPISLSTEALFLNAMGSAIRLGHLPGDRWLACLPLSHMGGLSILLRCAWLGTCVVLHPQFDAKRVAQTLDAGHVNMISLVPTMLQRVLDARQNENAMPAQLRVVLVGGGPMSEELQTRCDALSMPVARTWGLTELASQVCTTEPGAPFVDGCGAPLPFVRVRKEDDVLTVQGLGSRTWFRTQDTGTIDDKGRVSVAGRSDRIIISGGKNIAPQPIEAVLREISDVDDVAVVGVPHKQWGSAAIMVWEGGATSNAVVRELEKHADVAWPIKASVRVERLPKTQLGKIRFGLLRDRLGNREPGLFEAPEKILGDGDGLKVLSVHTRVRQSDHHPRFIAAGDAIAKGHRATAAPLKVDGHREHVTCSNGTRVVGFGVNDGHQPGALSKERAPAAESGCHQVFEGGVRVLIDAAKEDDPGGVIVVESRDEGGGESHAHSSRLKM